jgi:hypothetical protein
MKFGFHVKEGKTDSRSLKNRALRRIIKSRKDQVMGVWRKLHNEELHNLYSSPNTCRMRCKGHDTYMEEMGNVLVGGPEETTLKIYTQKEEQESKAPKNGVGRYRLNLFRSAQGPLSGSCEPSSSINSR